ncbi:anti-sigma factor domain-containing protein [Lentibacillus amyloliquefaciens]|uniref:RsgI N-terminal anti-sigma domain-containing protein n=1 Tax=Lentibacillus amyloliquefaciens TaxID=1472767 RepID=A0A0U3W6D8_9BACI|nr:hypothetical protein [Lentibacillus amyloliquefaciens]ALX48738.1 hypothetical protein AOX59_08980 [Lentibacillus amyloliquefaciens]
MKKGIVMEKHRNYIIVMRRDGTFQKARPLENVSIGMEVNYQPLSAQRPKMFHYINNKKRGAFAAVMACLMLLFVPFYFMTDKDKTYAYVNITINPNLELEIDNQLNVKSIAPLNDDAKSFLPMLTGYKGKHLEKVIQQIITKSEEAALLKNGKNILAGVSYAEDAQEEFSVTQMIDEYFGENDQDWGIVTFQIPKEIHDKSLDNERSMNELMARNLSNENVSLKNSIQAEMDTFINDDERDIIHSFYNIQQDNSDSGSNSNEKDTDKSEHIESSDENPAIKSEQPDKPESSQKKNQNTGLKTNNSKPNSDTKRNGPGNKNTNNHDEGKANYNNGKAKGHDKSKHNNGKAKGHGKSKHNNGKAKGHDKSKHNNGKAKGHDKSKHNNGKAKGHGKSNHNNGKAKGHGKTNHNNGKAKGHDKGKHNNGKGPK